MTLNKLKGGYLVKYTKLLQIFDEYIASYARSKYGIESWVKFDGDAAFDMKSTGNLPHMFGVRSNIEISQFILFDVLDAIEEYGDDGLVQSLYRPKYLADLWCYKAFNVISDLEYLKIEGIKRSHEEIKNITIYKKSPG